jgi:type I restriction enzyme, S subunit
MTGTKKPTIAGPIPEEWDARLIKSCCNVVRGASPRPAGDPRYFDGDYLPWITVADVTGKPGMYLDGTRAKLTKEGAKFTRHIPPETLIITNSGATLGAPKITQELSGANDGIAVFLELKGISKECLFYILESKTEYFRNELAPGVGQPNLNTELLGDVAIPIPPAGEQKRIVGALSTWDTAIQKTEQLIAAKEQQYSARSGELLFGLTRLKKYGTSKSKSLHWFSMSNEWSIVEIGQIAREVSSVNGGADDLPVLSCTKYGGLVDSLQYFNKQVFSHDTSKYKLVRRGQFAYATNHIEEGSIGYQDFVPAGLVSPIYTVFQTDTSQIDDGYLYKTLKTERLRQLFAANTNASVDRRGSLRWKEFARIHIPLPPLEEQRSINTILDTAKQEIALLKAEVVVLKTQKRGLMQKLLTGQWRLPVHEEGGA